MKAKKVASMKTEHKKLLIFLSVTYGLAFLGSVPLAILSMEGQDMSTSVVAHALCPAAGLMLSKLICDKDKSMIPKTFFIGFLVVTFVSALMGFITIFRPDIGMSFTHYYAVSNPIIGIVMLVVLFFGEDDEKLRVHGLKGKNWGMSFQILVLFVAILLAGIFISDVATGGLPTLAERLGRFSQFQLSSLFWILLIGFLSILPSTLGEEYGWRVYFQPLLQQKLGLIKGVFVFGLLWELWHLPFLFLHYTSTMALAQLILVRLIRTPLLAIFMAYAYMRTNNLWLVVWIHLLNNYIAQLPGLINDVDTTGYIASPWSQMGIFILIQMVSFLPFLFSKVFRTTQTGHTRTAVREPAPPGEEDK